MIKNYKKLRRVTEGEFTLFNKLFQNSKTDIISKSLFISIFYMLWKKNRLFSHIKHHSTLEMDTFKVMLLLFFISHHWIKNLALDFKSPFIDIEIFIFEVGDIPNR